MDFPKLKHYVLLLLIIVITAVFCYIISPFAYPILWAAIIAGLFYPMYRWLREKIKSPNVSATITLATVFLVIIVPVSLLATLVVSESIELYNSVSDNSGQISSSVKTVVHWVETNPYTARLHVDQTFWTQKLGEITSTITSYLINAAKTFTQNSLVFVLMFVIMFYALFFFIRDGERILKRLMHLCPLGDTHEKMLYNRFVSTTRATLKGSLIVGLVQGGLGGAMFVLAGIPGSIIWAIVMTLLSVIPGIGSYFVWLPVAIVVMITGKIWVGIAMILFGTLVIGTIDNILRPVLVGKDTQMHPLLVLFSTLGGIVIFGVSGFVIGPVITALFLAFWEMYEHAYREELEKN